MFEANKPMDEIAKKHGDVATTDMIVAHLRSRLSDTAARSRMKRADFAVQLLSQYIIHDKLFCRKVLDPHVNAFVERVVVPGGGLRACWYNGRRYKLTVREQMMLLHHDSELTGAHTSANDTMAKITVLD